MNHAQPPGLGQVVKTLVAVLVLGTCTVGLYAQRERVKPDDEPEEPPPEQTNRRQVTPEKKLDRYFRTIPDDKSYYIFISPSIVFQQETPLVDEINFDSSATYLGAYGGAGIAFGQDYFVEATLGVSILNSVAIGQFEIEGLSQTLYQLSAAGGPSFQLSEQLAVMPALGLNVTIWSARSFDGSTEQDSGDASVFAKLALSLRYEHNDRLGLRVGGQFLYNLNPGYGESIGINRLFSYMLMPELSLVYTF